MSKLVVTAKTGKTVNLRAQPSTNAQVIQRIPISTEVDLIEKRSDGWDKIKYLEMEGYMKSEFLKSQSTISQSDLREVYNSLNETLTLIEKILK